MILLYPHKLWCLTLNIYNFNILLLFIKKIYSLWMFEKTPWTGYHKFKVGTDDFLTQYVITICILDNAYLLLLFSYNIQQGTRDNSVWGCPPACGCDVEGGSVIYRMLQWGKTYKAKEIQWS